MRTHAWLVVCGLLASCENAEERPFFLRRGQPAGPRFEDDLRAVSEGTPELRYRALLDLRRFDGAEVRATLRRFLRSSDPLARNAAARSLVELGETNASEALIANLGPPATAEVARDAAHHLRVIHDRDEGLVPELGFEHRRGVQARWWAFWADRSEGRMHARPVPGREWSNERKARREALLRSANPTTRNVPPPEFHALLEDVRSSGLAEDLRAAREASQAWCGTHPDDAPGLYLRALVLRDVGAHDEALAVLGTARARSVQPHVLLASLLEEVRLERGLGRPVTAARLLGDVPEERREAAWFVELAWTELAEGRTAEAITAFERAEERDPEDWARHRLWRERLEGGAKL